MGIEEKLRELEEEMARTQKNKATEYHIGLLKAKNIKLVEEGSSDPSCDPVTFFRTRGEAGVDHGNLGADLARLAHDVWPDLSLDQN